MTDTRSARPEVGAEVTRMPDAARPALSGGSGPEGHAGSERSRSSARGRGRAILAQKFASRVQGLPDRARRRLAYWIGEADKRIADGHYREALTLATEVLRGELVKFAKPESNAEQAAELRLRAIEQILSSAISVALAAAHQRRSSDDSRA